MINSPMSQFANWYRRRCRGSQCCYNTKVIKGTPPMTNTVRIIDKLGLFPETRGKARYVTVKTYAHAMEIVDEQNKLGNIATLINW